MLLAHSKSFDALHGNSFVGWEPKRKREQAPRTPNASRVTGPLVGRASVWSARSLLPLSDATLRRTGKGALAFTLIELMIVVGIIALVLTFAVPGIYRYLHPSPIQKALDDVLSACRDAREAAVLSGATAALTIDLKSKTFSIGAASPPRSETAPSSEFPELIEQRPRAASSGHSYQLPSNVLIEGLGINGLDYTDDEQAEVRFYAKGTSDEFSIVLNFEQRERRNIFLDSVTGHADYEVDPMKFRHR